MKTFLNRWADLYRSILSDDSVSPAVQRGILGLILIACLTVRLWTIGAPKLDRTNWKEIDHIAVSTNYWKHGFNFLRPEVTWPATPPRVTEMEFPIVPYTAALLYEVLGFNAYSVRLITLLSFLFLIIYVFRLARRELGSIVGLLTALASSIMPLYHPFGNFLFSEPLLVAASVATVFYFAQWTDFQRRRDWVLAMLSFSLAVSLKPTALYMLLPLFWIAFRRYKWRASSYQSFFTLVLSALVLPLLWYSHAYFLETEGVHQFGIFRGHNKFQTFTMLTDPDWYRTLVAQIAIGILGGVDGAILCLTGFLVAMWLRKGDLFFAYLVAIGAFFVIVAEGQVDTPYRQLVVIPPLSAFVALGVIAVLVTAVAAANSIQSVRASRWPRVLACLIGCILVISAVPDRRHAIINWIKYPSRPAHPGRWEFAQEIAKYVGPEAKLAIAGEYSVHVGGNDLSPVLLHYLDLQGWNLQPKDWRLTTIEGLIQKGATHFVALPTYSEPASGPFLRDKVGARFVDELKERYQTLYESGNWLLLDLQQPIER